MWRVLGDFSPATRRPIAANILQLNPDLASCPGWRRDFDEMLLEFEEAWAREHRRVDQDEQAVREAAAAIARARRGAS